VFVAYAVSAVLVALARLTSARTKLTRHERVYVRKPIPSRRQHTSGKRACAMSNQAWKQGVPPDTASRGRAAGQHCLGVTRVLKRVAPVAVITVPRQ
jgi:hypothetical protein